MKQTTTAYLPVSSLSVYPGFAFPAPIAKAPTRAVYARRDSASRGVCRHKVAKRAMAFLGAIALVVAFHQAHAAPNTPSACDMLPYVGVCNQGCDVNTTRQVSGSPQFTLASNASSPADAKSLPVKRASASRAVDCEATPYLSPACPGSE